MGKEITFYNSEGEAVAYSEDGCHIYLFDGRAVYPWRISLRVLGNPLGLVLGRLGPGSPRQMRVLHGVVQRSWYCEAPAKSKTLEGAEGTKAAQGPQNSAPAQAVAAHGLV